MYENSYSCLYFHTTHTFIYKIEDCEYSAFVITFTLACILQCNISVRISYCEKERVDHHQFIAHIESDWLQYQ